MQIRNAIFLGILFALSPVSAMQAQPKSSPVAPNPATPGPTELKVGAASASLLSSPFLPAAVKTQILKEAQEEKEAYAIVKGGDDLAKSGSWQAAQSQYRQALDSSPEDGSAHRLALYGMIACCRTAGDTVGGLTYSRQVIYRHGAVAEGFFENSPEPLMQFVLLLNKAGQTAEAMSVYNHAAYALDYQDSQYNGGKPHLKVLLPEVVEERLIGDQVRYTPERLQALAETGIAHEEMGFGSDKEAVAHMQDAVKLYPDSPVTYYYLGDALLIKNRVGAKAAYQKAVQFGDAQTAAAVNGNLGTRQ